jgi:hypothetical protein
MERSDRRADAQAPSQPGATAQPTLPSDTSDFISLAEWIEVLDRIRDTCSAVQQRLGEHLKEAVESDWWPSS